MAEENKNPEIEEVVKNYPWYKEMEEKKQLAIDDFLSRDRCRQGIDLNDKHSNAIRRWISNNNNQFPKPESTDFAITEKQLRYDCLMLAGQGVQNTAQVLAKAQKYFDYVMNGPEVN